MVLCELNTGVKTEGIGSGEQRMRVQRQEADMRELVHGDQQLRSDMDAAVQSVKESVFAGERKGSSPRFRRCRRSCPRPTSATGIRV